MRIGVTENQEKLHKGGRMGELIAQIHISSSTSCHRRFLLLNLKQQFKLPGDRQTFTSVTTWELLKVADNNPFDDIDRKCHHRRRCHFYTLHQIIR